MWGVPLGQSQQAACSTRVVWLPRPPQSPRTPQQRQLVTMASQSPRRRPSVLTQLLSIPRRVDAYFAGDPQGGVEHTCINCAYVGPEMHEYHSYNRLCFPPP